MRAVPSSFAVAAEPSATGARLTDGITVVVATAARVRVGVGVARGIAVGVGVGVRVARGLAIGGRTTPGGVGVLVPGTGVAVGTGVKVGVGLAWWPVAVGEETRLRVGVGVGNCAGIRVATVVGGADRSGIGEAVGAGVLVPISANRTTAVEVGTGVRERTGNAPAVESGAARPTIVGVGSGGVAAS